MHKICAQKILVKTRSKFSKKSPRNLPLHTPCKLSVKLCVFTLCTGIIFGEIFRKFWVSRAHKFFRNFCKFRKKLKIFKKIFLKNIFACTCTSDWKHCFTRNVFSKISGKFRVHTKFARRKFW